MIGDTRCGHENRAVGTVGKDHVALVEGADFDRNGFIIGEKSQYLTFFSNLMIEFKKVSVNGWV